MTRTCKEHGRETPCGACAHTNAHVRGTRKPYKATVFKPDGDELPAYPRDASGRIRDPEDFGRWFESVYGNDPIAQAALATAIRRPGNVSKFRHGVAGRTALREPMLNAVDPFKAERLLNNRAKEVQARLKVYKRFQVKPVDMRVARGNWSAREWSLWTLRYAPGYVIVNHAGEESPVYPSWHRAKEAIQSAGWEVIK